MMIICHANLMLMLFFLPKFVNVGVLWCEKSYFDLQHDNNFTWSSLFFVLPKMSAYRSEIFSLTKLNIHHFVTTTPLSSPCHSTSLSNCWLHPKFISPPIVCLFVTHTLSTEDVHIQLCCVTRRFIILTLMIGFRF